MRLEIQQQRKVKDDGGRSAKQSDDLGSGVKGQLSQPHASTPTSELAEGSLALDNDPVMPTAEARKVLPSEARPFSETWYYNPVRRTLESVQEQGGEEELMQARAIKRETEINHPGQSVYAGWKARKRLKTSQASMKSSGKGNANKYSLDDSHLTSSDSESDDSEPEIFHRKHRTPILPKMQTFDGKSSEWGPFIFQFRNLAKAGHWTGKEKRDGLLACLRGKAITYVQSKPREERADYQSLRDLLAQRYGVMELPSTARRQLSAMRQEEGEALEDFADRIILKAGKGFQRVPEETLQSLATEAFLRGCKDRNAAYAASERKPETLQQAVVEMRDAAANVRAFGRTTVIA